jgi:ABC-type phosphate transport system substrate-binding protein
MRRRSYPLLLLLAVLGVLASGPPLRAATGFVVIVNAGNPVSSLPSDEVSRIFLHKAQVWPNGARMAAVDLPEEAPARDAFSHAIHTRSAAAVKAYWQRMIFSGRDLPPPEKTAAEVLALVRSSVGAIGYLPADMALGDGVKILRITR